MKNTLQEPERQCSHCGGSGKEPGTGGIVVSKQGEDREWEDAGEYMGCCDCGLVHRMEYRVVDRDGEEIVPGNGESYLQPTRIQLRATREKEMTEEARR